MWTWLPTRKCRTNKARKDAREERLAAARQRVARRRQRAQARKATPTKPVSVQDGDEAGLVAAVERALAAEEELLQQESSAAQAQQAKKEAKRRKQARQRARDQARPARDSTAAADATAAAESSCPAAAEAGATASVGPAAGTLHGPREVSEGTMVPTIHPSQLLQSNALFAASSSSAVPPTAISVINQPDAVLVNEAGNHVQSHPAGHFEGSGTDNDAVTRSENGTGSKSLQLGLAKSSSAKGPKTSSRKNAASSTSDDMLADPSGTSDTLRLSTSWHGVNHDAEHLRVEPRLQEKATEAANIKEVRSPAVQGSACASHGLPPKLV